MKETLERIADTIENHVKQGKKYINWAEKMASFAVGVLRAFPGFSEDKPAEDSKPEPQIKE